MLLKYSHSWSDFDEIGLSRKKNVMFSYCYSCTTQNKEKLEQQMKDAIFPICEASQEMYA
jgi:hypothetical protein